MGEGIWCLSETQLSHVTMPACSRALRSLARQQGRQLRFHHGDVAPIRQNSQWAGSWTGVLTASDFPSQTLRVPLPAGIQESGRLLFTFHDVAGLPITGATIYGYRTSASHPRAREATNNLLASVTRQLVYGRQGPRFVAGDFNHHPHELSEIQQWLSEGWVEVQSFAARLWGQPIVPTCKGATQRDLIYISPELAAMCSQVSTFQCFAEHDTVVASFVLPRATLLQRTWPLPAQIPWDAVDSDNWHRQPFNPPEAGLSSTAWFLGFARNFEKSLNGHMHELPHPALPNACRGRAQ